MKEVDMMGVNSIINDRPVIDGFVTVSPFRIITTYDDNWVEIVCEQANIRILGTDENQAKKMLSRGFKDAWRNYVLCDVRELSQSALEYRNWLTSHLKVKK